MVSAPLATTQKAKEDAKVRELIQAVKAEPTQSMGEMEYYSDGAIDFIFQQASVEPENQRILNVPVPARHNIGIAHILLTLGLC